MNKSLDTEGIDPSTFRMRSGRSTTDLSAHEPLYIFKPLVLELIFDQTKLKENKIRKAKRQKDKKSYEKLAKLFDRPRTRTWNLLIRSQVRYPITPAGRGR